MSELIGKRVRLISLEPLLKGVTGVLRAYNDEEDVYAFEADEDGFLFHSCGGLTLRNRGRWVGLGDFEVIPDEPIQPYNENTCENEAEIPVEPIAEQTTCKSEETLDLPIGTRVQIGGNTSYDEVIGKTGTIKGKEFEVYAVEMDDKLIHIDHDCEGKTKRGYGYYVSPSNITILGVPVNPVPCSEHYDEHYASSIIQPIEFMVANFTREEMIGFLKGNIIKYTSRMGKKDDPTKETAKIKRYSEWLKEYQTTGKITI